MLVRLNPSMSPRGGTQTGMSDHGSTFCAARKSASTQINVAAEFSAALMPSSRPPIDSAGDGPVAL